MSTSTATEALDRVIYLLDRSLAPVPKVRAFAKARALVDELTDEQLDHLVTAGKITDLDGIGASTGQVISAAVRGEDCSYTAKLEASTVVTADGGHELRNAIKGDCHTHTTWSDGGASVEAMAATAASLGHEYLVVTDHSPRLTIAHGLTPERLEGQLDEIDTIRERIAGVTILAGMEVDILEDGNLDLPDELLSRLDLVVASVHHKLAMPHDQMTARMIKAISSPYTDVLGHCTNRKVMGRGRKPSQFDADLVFAACKHFDTAVEINCRPERQDPPEELVRLAIGYGTKFAINTDAHAPGQMEWQLFGCEKAELCGIDPDDIINTWSTERLLAWTASHESTDSDPPQ